MLFINYLGAGQRGLVDQGWTVLHVPIYSAVWYLIQPKIVLATLLTHLAYCHQ